MEIERSFEIVNGKRHHCTACSRTIMISLHITKIRKDSRGYKLNQQTYYLCKICVKDLGINISNDPGPMKIDEDYIDTENKIYYEIEQQRDIFVIDKSLYDSFMACTLELSP